MKLPKGPNASNMSNELNVPSIRPANCVVTSSPPLPPRLYDQDRPVATSPAAVDDQRPERRGLRAAECAVAAGVACVVASAAAPGDRQAGAAVAVDHATWSRALTTANAADPAIVLQDLRGHLADRPTSRDNHTTLRLRTSLQQTTAAHLCLAREVHLLRRRRQPRQRLVQWRFHEARRRVQRRTCRQAFGSWATARRRKPSRYRPGP